MSKYIRTKDGHIYEIETKESGGIRKGYFKNADNNFNLYHSLLEWQLDCKSPYYLDTPNGYTVCKKQADTIEELCDIFVEVKNGDTFGSHFAWNKRSLNEYNKYRKNTHTIYGAIWTDKGLIFVARMNEKGELELI